MGEYLFGEETCSEKWFILCADETYLVENNNFHQLPFLYRLENKAKSSIFDYKKSFFILEQIWVLELLPFRRAYKVKK